MKRFFFLPVGLLVQLSFLGYIGGAMLTDLSGRLTSIVSWPFAPRFTSCGLPILHSSSTLTVLPDSLPI